MTAAEMPITYDVSEISREQLTLRIGRNDGAVDNRIVTFLDDFVGMRADHKVLPLAEYSAGENIFGRKRDGSLAIYKVTGRTVGRLLLAEVG